MADVEVVKKRGRPSKRDSADGQVSSDSIGAGTDDCAAIEVPSERVAMTWAEFDKLIYKWEWDNKSSRITLLYFDGDDAPVHYSGCYSECDVAYGKPGYRLSTGEIVEINC